MKKGIRILLVVAAFVLLASYTPARVASAASRQVYAYYFGWYTGDSWNDGRLIDHPAPRYNSTDGGTIARHIAQAKGAGIDAFILSWFGPKGNNLTNIVLNTLLDQAASAGFHAGVSVDMGQDNFNGSTGEVLDSLKYLIGDRVNHPAYVRYNGKPVIYFWNQRKFSVQDWTNIRAQVDPRHNTIWVAEGTDVSYLRVFDGLYLFNVAWSSSFGGTAGGWMSKTYGAGGKFYTPTAMPGWDESRISGRANPTTAKDRGNGSFLKASWSGAISSGANVILVVSWNEFLENSYVEPSEKYGTQTLDLLRSLIAAWKH